MVVGSEMETQDKSVCVIFKRKQGINHGKDQDEVVSLSSFNLFVCSWFLVLRILFVRVVKNKYLVYKWN